MRTVIAWTGVSHAFQALFLVTNKFSYLPIKTYVVCVRKNHLNEIVLLNTKIFFSIDGEENSNNFIIKMCFNI